MKSDSDDPKCPLCGGPMRPFNSKLWYCVWQSDANRMRRKLPKGHKSMQMQYWDEGRLDAWHSPA